MFPDLEKALLTIEALLKELKLLNENLLDLKIMIAPYLGFRVVKKGGEDD